MLNCDNELGKKTMIMKAFSYKPELKDKNIFKEEIMEIKETINSTNKTTRL